MHGGVGTISSNTPHFKQENVYEIQSIGTNTVILCAKLVERLIVNLKGRNE